MNIYCLPPLDGAISQAVQSVPPGMESERDSKRGAKRHSQEPKKKGECEQTQTGTESEEQVDRDQGGDTGAGGTEVKTPTSRAAEYRGIFQL
jgi:hypothetical protein